MSQFASPQAAQLTAQGTLNSTTTWLAQCFDLSADGDLCKTRDLYQILPKAAANCTTLEATCHDSPAAPDRNTIRGYLKDPLRPTALRDLETRCNRARDHRWPHWRWSQPLEIALDLHDEGYYGDYADDDPACGVVKAEKRAGTQHFYRCATIRIVRQDLRLTLAVVFVHPDASLVDVLATLVTYVRGRGLRIGCLYADNGFCSIAILAYLRHHTRDSAILAAPRKGAQHGIKSLCRGRSSYFTQHTFKRGQQELTVDVAMIRTYTHHRHQPRRATWLAYALIRVKDTLHHIRERYCGRFGIDTGYRSMEQVRARTGSQNPALRFFLRGLALILVNGWLCLRGVFLAPGTSGAQRYVAYQLTLEQRARFLIHAVEAIYGVLTAIEPPNL